MAEKCQHGPCKEWVFVLVGTGRGQRQFGPTAIDRYKATAKDGRYRKAWPRGEGRRHPCIRQQVLVAGSKALADKCHLLCSLALRLSCAPACPKYISPINSSTPQYYCLPSLPTPLARLSVPRRRHYSLVNSTVGAEIKGGLSNADPPTGSCGGGGDETNKAAAAHLVPRQVQNQVPTELFRRGRIQIQKIGASHADAEVLVELPCCERDARLRVTTGVQRG